MNIKYFEASKEGYDFLIENSFEEIKGCKTDDRDVFVVDLDSKTFQVQDKHSTKCFIHSAFEIKEILRKNKGPLS